MHVSVANQRAWDYQHKVHTALKLVSALTSCKQAGADTHAERSPNVQYNGTDLQVWQRVIWHSNRCGEDLLTLPGNRIDAHLS